MDFTNIQALCASDVMQGRSVQCGIKRIPPGAPLPVPRIPGTWKAPGTAADHASDQAAGADMVQPADMRVLLASLASLAAGGSAAGAAAQMRQPAVPA